MDRLKKFLTEKKVNKNFKRAGAGYRLTGDSSSAAVPQPAPVQQQAVIPFLLLVFKIFFTGL